MITEKKSYKTKQDHTIACAEYLSQLVDISSRPLLLFYSGGSNADVILKFLELRVTKSKNNDIVLAPIDERFSAEQSNYLNIKNNNISLYQQSIETGITWLDTSPTEKDQYAMALTYSKQLRTTIAACKENNGTILALVGMGQDGHFAGIFPNTQHEASFYTTYVDTTSDVVGIDIPSKKLNPKRFTVTIKGMEYVDRFILSISGEQKQNLVELIETTRPPIHQIPASFLWYTQTPCVLFSS